ncbi:hypothetical protein BDN71DRAFT_1438631 [Pleurotus eryngii]|uniref:Uncharacterized protein n=1 Tax=Pleurotus eryngii TaxID=5323 RepID=A0A9P6A9T1_PLEER|nr:hypothetical protein BDN71DRAFT_1438631 [Pleurotus eryngii]
MYQVQVGAECGNSRRLRPASNGPGMPRFWRLEYLVQTRHVLAGRSTSTYTALIVGVQLDSDTSFLTAQCSEVL